MSNKESAPSVEADKEPLIPVAATRPTSLLLHLWGKLAACQLSSDLRPSADWMSCDRDPLLPRALSILALTQQKGDFAC